MDEVVCGLALDEAERKWGLWFVVCGLWFVVCGLWFVVCGLWFVVCGLWFVVCGLWFVVCGLWFVVCGLWFVVCGLWFVGCGLRFVVCVVWFVVCGLWFVVSSVLAQNGESDPIHSLGASPETKAVTNYTERIKNLKAANNSSERSLKKQASSASNKSISLIENLHTRLNRKFSNRSITKLTDAKKELVARRGGPLATDTSTRADSTSSSTHKLT